MTPPPVSHPDTPATDGAVLPLPPRVPRRRANRVARWAGQTILRLGGWRMAGAIADEPKVVLIGAPHSSTWDGVWGVAAVLAMGLDVRVLGKKELFGWPMGPILRWLGVVEIDRQAPGGFVDQTAALMRSADAFWLGIAPEGTRKAVREWKTGFWKIARAAGVPVQVCYFHYPDKRLGFGPLLWMSDDPAADMARIRAWYAPWLGRNRGTV